MNTLTKKHLIKQVSQHEIIVSEERNNECDYRYRYGYIVGYICKKCGKECLTDSGFFRHFKILHNKQNDKTEGAKSS